ncbi:MAG TPA: hypothetical protein VLF20_04805, partial [Patescibacteria group bacterium]|nr:hypothetical protein [Patescibacteria group bacterium]
MKQKILIGFLLLISLFALQQPAPFFPVQEAYSSNETRLATHEMSLETRYANPAINDVFKDNILLTLSYMSGRVKTASDIHWDDVRAERQYELV